MYIDIIFASFFRTKNQLILYIGTTAAFHENIAGVFTLPIDHNAHSIDWYVQITISTIPRTGKRFLNRFV